MKTAFKQVSKNEWHGDLSSCRGEIAWTIEKSDSEFILWLFGSMFYGSFLGLDSAIETANKSFAQIQNSLNF